MMLLLDSVGPPSQGAAWLLSQAWLCKTDPSGDVDLAWSQDTVQPRTSDAEAVPKIGDILGGKFRITEMLGEGGMGVVLGGEHLDLRQTVAIKVLRPSLAKEPDALARFLREARAAASIRSRHAARIQDVGTTDAGVPYMVMDRLRGTPVDKLLEEQGFLAHEDAVRIIVQAADAIAEANAMGIVHRDLKPSNLFLADDGSGAPIVKVLDFGISKRVTVEDGNESASLTAPQTLLGSPQYMSPEQLRDPRSVDERTDVWGLGVTLYELVTGRTPFDSDSMPELYARIFSSVPTPATEVRSTVPAALSDVITRCLAKRPEDRVPSVAALVALLVPFCGDDMRASAEQLARTARPTLGAPIDEPRRSQAPTDAGVRRKRILAVAASAAVAVTAFAALRGRGGEAVDLGAAPPAASVATSAVVSSASASTSASAPTAAVDSSPPTVAATQPEAGSAATSPRSSAPSAPARPRGLKGIKLID